MLKNYHVISCFVD